MLSNIIMVILLLICSYVIVGTVVIIFLHIFSPGTLQDFVLWVYRKMH